MWTPFLDMNLSKLYRSFRQWHDRYFTCDQNLSKSRNFARIVKLYKGFEFEVHFNIATLFIISFIALTYGPVMPVCIALALITFII